MLVLATAFLVPFGFTCAIIASESPVTQEQYVRLNKMANEIGVPSLIVEFVGAVLLQRKPIRPLRFVGVVGGCVLGASFGGVLISSVFLQWWWRVVQVFM